MLPHNLLPDIGLVRAQAQQFMTSIVTLFEPTITYDDYGQQIITSGTGVQVSGYVGALSGKDKELLRSISGNYTYRNGKEISHTALLLLPFGTIIEENYIVLVNNQQYDVIFTNNDTSDAVQVYTKAIITRVDRVDDITL
jgi:predicted TIM-barrel enzyme